MTSADVDVDILEAPQYLVCVLSLYITFSLLKIL